MRKYNLHVLTTGEVADICGVAPHTVSKWYDSGEFPNAFRIPGGSNDRRIPNTDLLAFISRHKIVTNPMWIVDRRVWVVGKCGEVPGIGLAKVEKSEILAAAASIQTPNVFTKYVISCDRGRDMALDLARVVPLYHPTPVIVMSDDTAAVAGVRADFYYHDAIPWREVVEDLLNHNSGRAFIGEPIKKLRKANRAKGQVTKTP